MNRTGLSIAASVAGPLVLVSAYLLLSRWPDRLFSATSDFSAIGIAVIAGLAGVVCLRLPALPKTVVILAYVPVAFLLLSAYSLGFVCAVFSDCL